MNTAYNGFENRLTKKDLPMSSSRLLAPALLALALCGAPPAASAQSFTDTQRGDIETIVKNYLVAHPEVLEEAMNELQQAADRRRDRRSMRQASRRTRRRSSTRRAA